MTSQHSGEARSEDLDRLERILAKASKAPWEAKRNRHPNLNGTPWGWIEGIHDYSVTWSGPTAKHDADAIAAMRNALPGLINELRRFRDAQGTPDALPCDFVRGAKRNGQYEERCIRVGPHDEHEWARSSDAGPYAVGDRIVTGSGVLKELRGRTGTVTEVMNRRVPEVRVQLDGAASPFWFYAYDCNPAQRSEPARRWKATDVACPECLVSRGQPCRGGPHAVREEAAKNWIPPETASLKTSPRAEDRPETADPVARWNLTPAQVGEEAGSFGTHRRESAPHDDGYGTCRVSITQHLALRKVAEAARELRDWVEGPNWSGGSLPLSKRWIAMSEALGALPSSSEVPK